MILHLHLKGCYWQAIKDGTKVNEYRLADKWEKRIAGKPFTKIRLMLGYPKRGDKSRVIVRRWKGYKIGLIRHSEFGDKLVCVVVIDVSK